MDLHYGGDPKLWEKPPLGLHLRSSSPSPSQQLQQQQNGFGDPNNAGYRSRIGSNGSDVTAPIKPARPQVSRNVNYFRTYCPYVKLMFVFEPQTPPANAYRRIDQSAFGTLPRRTPSQLTTFNNGVSADSAGPKGTSFSSGNLNAVHFQQQENGTFIPTAKQAHPITYALHLKPFQQQQFSSMSGDLGQQQQLQPGGAYSGGAGAGCGLFYAADPNSGPRSTSAPNLGLLLKNSSIYRSPISSYPTYAMPYLNIFLVSY